MKIRCPWVVLIIAALFIYIGAMACHGLARTIYNLVVTAYIYKDGVPVRVSQPAIPPSTQATATKILGLNILDPINLFLVPIGIGLVRLRESSRKWSLALVLLNGLLPLLYFKLALTPISGRRIIDMNGHNWVAADHLMGALLLTFMLLLIVFVLTRPSIKAAFAASHLRDKNEQP